MLTAKTLEKAKGYCSKGDKVFEIHCAESFRDGDTYHYSFFAIGTNKDRIQEQANALDMGGAVVNEVEQVYP